MEAAGRAVKQGPEAAQPAHLCGRSSEASRITFVRRDPNHGVAPDRFAAWRARRSRSACDRDGHRRPGAGQWDWW